MVERCVRDAEAVGSNPVASITLINDIRPIGQAVKTTPSHGVNPGSIPGLVITEEACHGLLFYFIAESRMLSDQRTPGNSYHSEQTTGQ